jgi:hypothetical protein
MEQRPIHPDRGIQPNAPERGGEARRSGPAGPTARHEEAAGASPAFHVLLDRLQRSAQELQENADAVERPSDLAGAVGRAKASLDDALDLGDRLLEAWRAERMNPTPTDDDR